MTETIEISFDEVVKMLDKSYDLAWVDYRESLDERMNIVQEAVHKQNMEPIWEETDEWFWECRADSVDHAIDELKDSIIEHYDLDENEDLCDFFEEYEDQLKDIINERDHSDPVGDLIRNTRDPICFYDLGLDVESGSWQYTEEEMKESLKQVKKALKIPLREKKWDKSLWLMIAQASYGGQLVVYFVGDIDDLVNLGDNNTITFKNPEVAIIDTVQGSGDNTDLPGHEFSIALDPENIFFDRCIKYSYTYDVCGMVGGWCDGTKVSFSKKRRRNKTTEKSSLHDKINLEKIFQEVYDAGKCSYDDIRMDRHRDTYYINAFPCGTHCPHCHRFWID